MERLAYKKEKFLKSLNALKRSIEIFFRETLDEDIKESLVASNVKHFEMSYEACWKFLQCYLDVKFGQKIDSPKKIIRECFALGVIDASTTKELLAMCDARNSTVHDYDEETAQELCARLGDYYKILSKLDSATL